MRSAISFRQDAEEARLDSAHCWVGEWRVDEIEDEFRTGGKDGVGRLTTCKKNHWQHDFQEHLPGSTGKAGVGKGSNCWEKPQPAVLSPNLYCLHQSH